MSAGVIHEAPAGVPVYRRVLVGRVPRHPDGWALCLQCGIREADGAQRLFCSDACRAAHRRSMRPPKARFLPCPGCGAAFVRCPKTQGLCTAWRWRSRTPVWRANGEPVHGGTRPVDPFAPPAARGAR